MPTYGSNADAFARILNTTTADYTRKIIENIFTNQPFLAMLKSKKKVFRQPGGDSIMKIIRYKRSPLQTMSDMPSISFTRINKYVNAQQKPRGYWCGEMISFWERMLNQGTAAYVKLYDEMMRQAVDDFAFNFPKEIWKDGDAAGNDGIHGIPSYMSISGFNANDPRIGVPNDTYATLSTALGVKGTWTSGVTWPAGSGQPGYHYWSPLVLDYLATGWTGATGTFESTCLRMFTFAQIVQRGRGKKVDSWMLTPEAYYLAKNKVESKENIYTQRSQSSTPLIKLGFGNVFNYEGADVTYDSDVPVLEPNSGVTNAGYGLDFDTIELRHWTPQLLYTFPVDLSLETLTHRYLGASICNMFNDPTGTVGIRRTSGTTPIA